MLREVTLLYTFQADGIQRVAREVFATCQEALKAYKMRVPIQHCSYSCEDELMTFSIRLLHDAQAIETLHALMPTLLQTSYGLSRGRSSFTMRPHNYIIHDVGHAA